MLRVILLFLFMATALTSCKKDKCTSEKLTSSFAEDKSIVVQTSVHTQQKYYEILDGENIVFRYEHRYPQCEDVLDAKWGTAFIFEANKNASQFRFEGIELTSAKAFYVDHGGIAGQYNREIDGGVIEGTKISANQWKVKVNVTTEPLHANEAPKHIAFERVFEK